MLKRQRPATPPPSSLDDAPSYFPDRPVKPLPQRGADPSLSYEPRVKRRRVHAPVLDGQLRGWLTPNPIHLNRGESDGEEDWVEGVDDAAEENHQSGALSSISPADAERYKHANTLLHELHALHQHRLLFTNSAFQEVHLNQNLTPGIPPPTTDTHHPHFYAHLSGYGHGVGKPSPLSQSTGGKMSLPELSDRPMPSFHSHSAHLTPTGREYVTQPAQDQVDVHEVQTVRERYEDANRLLGSLFLSRRRELQGSISSATDELSGSYRR
ncbi:hypothetical protein HYDPIDRAFT_106992 [Hydnomerulius pinastri MD-312]|nr:hypothetical protein HYDPIDRAFT_106992 [Hydnomerulius pinastri MD-312]